jgi:8-oxo-dGTP diphosphatase
MLPRERNSIMRIIDKLAWIHIKDRKVLFLRSKGRDMFYFPGGKREPGETDLQALARELKEELDIDLKSETAQYVGTFKALAHGQKEPTEVQSACYSGEYDGKFAPQAEIEELAWLLRSDREKLTPLGVLLLEHLYSIGKID